MSKIEAIATVILVTILLAVALVSQVDATDSFDKRVTTTLKTGGTVRTQTMSKWQLHRYVEEQLPKKYPLKYAPWRSYVAIDKYVTVDADSTHHTLTIDGQLYQSIKPEADANRAEAKRILKRYKVKGKGKTAYKKIRRYIRSGKYITGIKSAQGFFENHGGDCSAHASAVYVLCKVQGIPVRFCIGAFDTGNGYDCHAWNRVKLNGVWYWVDETMGQPLTKRLWWDYKKPMEQW